MGKNVFLRVLWNCYELSRNQWLKPDKLKKLQEKRLRAILKHAYENVPLYHEKFESVGLKPDDIKTVEDLSKLPFTTKKEVRSGIPDRSIARGYNIDECVRMSTSGTTGGPMPVFYDKRFWDYIVADWYYRQLRVRGLNPWDRLMIIHYSTLQPTTRDREERSGDELKRKSRGREALGPSVSIFKRWIRRAYIAYSAEEIIPDIIEYKPGVLGGNASYLRLVAEAIVEKHVENIRPKALISWGEVLDEPTRKFLESSFGCEVFNSYGAYEVGSIAFDCQRKEALHICEDFVVLEVVRDGEPVGPGEPGEIVVTGLLNYAMPLIRYRVGDIGILDSEQCPCGRSFHLLKSVEGRAIDCFILPDGRKVTPKAIMDAIQGVPGVSRYQAVQKSINKVRIELMRREGDPEVSVEELVARCREVLGGNVKIEVFFGDRKGLKSKFRPVISKLTVAVDQRWTRPL